jgi:predicted pyridoxine 5'-phosphate oxidase superfamily flavin-nucleotide-binding protein
MSTTNTIHEVFHEGEIAVQQRAGAVAQGRNSGRMIADSIIPGAIKFVKKQPFVVIGSVDERQNLWASIVVGNTGFMTAEPRSLDVDLSQTVRIDADPLWRNLAGDARVGILVIDPRSRARLRVNGRVNFPTDDQLHVDVEQAYPNCPQYIQRRDYRPATEGANSQSESASGTVLSNQQQQWIADADTLFVASKHPSRGVDASHRGGNPGFIRIVNSTRLRIPDYAGNGMFNTLGNFAVNPRAGLVLPDFESGRTLQLTGRSEILWDVDEQHNETGGTGRYWDFEIDSWIQIENSLPGSSEFLDYSPHNPVSAA